MSAAAEDGWTSFQCFQRIIARWFMLVTLHHANLSNSSDTPAIALGKAHSSILPISHFSNIGSSPFLPSLKVSILDS